MLKVPNIALLIGDDIQGEAKPVMIFRFPFSKSGTDTALCSLHLLGKAFVLHSSKYQYLGTGKAFNRTVPSDSMLLLIR